MAFTQMRWLASARLNRIIGRLAGLLDIQRPLVYLARCPMVNAFDDELVGRFTGKIIAADLVADDQKALVYESMTLDVVTTTVPNVKLGQRLGQKLLNRIRQLEAGNMMVSGQNALKDWDTNLAENLLLGVRERLNAMACAMMLDSFSYDRFGVKISGASWGMPSGLKITPGTTWATAATATPLSDIWSADQYASLNYGISFDTVTMATQDFRDMVATTEFANKAAIVIGAGFSTGAVNMPKGNDPGMMGIATRILGKTIVLDDATYTTRSNDGTLTATRALPLHKVLLSRQADHGSGRSYDFANGIVTESVVADLIGGGDFGGIGADQYGPIGYYTPTSGDLNPPGVNAWAVTRAFPRKFVPESTAVLTVG